MENEIQSTQPTSEIELAVKDSLLFDTDSAPLFNAYENDADLDSHIDHSTFPRVLPQPGMAENLKQLKADYRTAVQAGKSALRRFVRS